MRSRHLEAIFFRFPLERRRQILHLKFAPKLEAGISSSSNGDQSEKCWLIILVTSSSSVFWKWTEKNDFLKKILIVKRPVCRSKYEVFDFWTGNDGSPHVRTYGRWEVNVDLNSLDEKMIITSANFAPIVNWLMEKEAIMMSSSCGLVDRAVASESGRPAFESIHQNFIKEHLVTVNCTEKKKRPLMGHVYDYFKTVYYIA